MNNFINRLASFATFPDNALVSSVQLSNDGFFYTGNQDEVECFQCHTKIKDWKEGDVPTDRHFKNSPSCPFVLKLLMANGGHPPSHQSPRNGIIHKHAPNQVTTVQSKSGANNFQINGQTSPTGEGPGGTNSNENAQPKVNVISNNDMLQVLQNQSNQGNQGSAQWFTKRETTTPNQNNLGSGETDFTIERNRLASFVGNWPRDSPVTPEELAAAGLYYIGPDDKVKCPWCKGGMYNWEDGDTGMGEHAKHFPQCPFVKQKMSEILHNPAPRSEAQSVSREVTQHTATQTNPNNWKDCPAVKIALNMGYDMKLVEKAVEAIKGQGQEITTEILVDALFDVENAEESISSTETGPTNSADREPESNYSNNKTNAHGNDQESKSLVRSKSQTTELSELMDENLKLKESTTCKICLENEVNTLFLPCRHLVCCEECSEAVRHCPLCRTLIVGTVKTFLS